MRCCRSIASPMGRLGTQLYIARDDSFDLMVEDSLLEQETPFPDDRERRFIDRVLSAYC